MQDRQRDAHRVQMIQELTDDEIAAAIQRLGRVLSTKESVREFRGLATSLAHQLEMKNGIPANVPQGPR